MIFVYFVLILVSFCRYVKLFFIFVSFFALLSKKIFVFFGIFLEAYTLLFRKRVL